MPPAHLAASGGMQPSRHMVVPISYADLLGVDAATSSPLLNQRRQIVCLRLFPAVRGRHANKCDLLAGLEY
jgi:hypothetical protein